MPPLLLSQNCDHTIHQTITDHAHVVFAVFTQSDMPKRRFSMMTASSRALSSCLAMTAAACRDGWWKRTAHRVSGMLGAGYDQGRTDNIPARKMETIQVLCRICSIIWALIHLRQSASSRMHGSSMQHTT
jgi:hypothetical protein